MVFLWFSYGFPVVFSSAPRRLVNKSIPPKASVSDALAINGPAVAVGDAQTSVAGVIHQQQSGMRF